VTLIGPDACKNGTVSIGRFKISSLADKLTGGTGTGITIDGLF
jgi:hypothetical protein